LHTVPPDPLGGIICSTDGIPESARPSNWDKDKDFCSMLHIHSHLHQLILLPPMVFLDLRFLQQHLEVGGGLAFSTLSHCLPLRVALSFLLLHLINICIITSFLNICLRPPPLLGFVLRCSSNFVGVTLVRNRVEKSYSIFSPK
jgi:hypothetical protein